MTASPLRSILMAVLAILPLLSSAAQAQATDDARDKKLAERRQELDKMYAFGPSTARSLGYRIAWQTSIDTEIARMDIVGPDIYVVDGRNIMTRIDQKNGSPIWSVTAADRNDTIWGVTEGLWFGASIVVWGVIGRTLLVWHITWSVNSLSHIFGYRNHETNEESRNNWFVALVSAGEGWHNNHHHDPKCCTVSHRWWELDVTHLEVRLLRRMGIVTSIVPRREERARLAMSKVKDSS